MVEALTLDMAPVIPMAASASNKDRARYEQQFYKTRPCSFFAKGKCTRGEKCKYAHGNFELQSRPDLSFTSLCRASDLRSFLSGAEVSSPRRAAAPIRSAPLPTPRTSCEQRRSSSRPKISNRIGAAPDFALQVPLAGSLPARRGMPSCAWR